MQNPCGSEPARDSGVSVDINFEYQSAIASKLAPTGDLWLTIDRGEAPGKQLLDRLCALAVALQQDDLPVERQFPQRDDPGLRPMLKPEPRLG